MVKCPESIEELQELEKLLPLCKKALYETAQAKLESGAAYSRRDAERQIAEETGRPFETIHSAIKREEKSQMHDMGALHPPCENVLQGGEKEADLLEDKEDLTFHRPPICSLMTGDQESYTPEKYIEAARLTMGSIDLDPASNEFAQKTVKSTIYYTKEENGLDKSWDGNIFLNPPYSHPDIKYFVDKLLSELKPNQQAILLTNNNTDTNFFHNAAKKASAICFTKGRINFNKLDGTTSSPTNGQVFFYFGKNSEKFIENFSEFGIIMMVVV